MNNCRQLQMILNLKRAHSTLLDTDIFEFSLKIADTGIGILPIGFALRTNGKELRELKHKKYGQLYPYIEYKYLFPMLFLPYN